MADTMFRFDNNSLSNVFLTDYALMQKCPNAFKEEPTNPNVSNRYVQATTIDVVRDMRSLGWFPVDAKQCRMKKNSSGIRSFHMIAFQNPDIKIMNGDEIEAFPRIILTNSHDGFNSFKFMVGLFRLVCSNGLIIADEQFENLAIRHINYTFDELRRIVCQAVENLPNRIEVLNKMKDTELTEEQRHDFVVEAIKYKKGFKEDDTNKAIVISKEEIDDFLTATRKEDEGTSLWATYNVIQEKLIKGGYMLSNGKKSRKQRGITGIKKDIDLNIKLFNIANSFMKKAS